MGPIVARHPGNLARRYNSGMQNCVLTSHPASACKAVQRIDVTLQRLDGTLQTLFRIFGDFSRLVVPEPEQPKRRDALWRHTCCEVFVGARDSQEYYEFNFAPSTAWAAYRFSAYRTGMATAEVSGPRVSVERFDDRLELSASVNLRECLGLKGAYRVSPTCVIEEPGNNLSYWALKHVADQPDFHHMASCNLELA